MATRFSPVPKFRHALVEQVRDRFNDRAKGERPVQRSIDALYGPDSVVWRVHGDVTSMMVGGLAALLTQMLHPAALAGVWDHSDVADDQLGRLRRTARFIAVTTYGQRDSALAAIEKVRSIHSQVSGTVPGGRTYRADDPALLAWVHVAGALMFLDGWRLYAQPRMSRRDQDSYFAESGEVARLLGADPVPQTRAAAEALVRQFRPQLRSDRRTIEFRDLVLKPKAAGVADAAAQRLIGAAAVDLMPDFARGLHGLRAPILARPLVRPAVLGLASTLRWAFAGEAYR